MGKPKIPELKALLSQVIIKPGDIPQLKFEHKQSVIKASRWVPQNLFFRAHISHECLIMMIPSGKSIESKMYILGPGLVLPAHLTDSITPVVCHLIAFPDGEIQILERKTARPEEPLNDMQQSSLNVINAAKVKWVMRKWNPKSFVYEYVEANDDYAPEPKWPEEEFMDILLKAYEGRIIDTINHPVYLELAGIKAAEND